MQQKFDKSVETELPLIEEQIIKVDQAVQIDDKIDLGKKNHQSMQLEQ